jgi:alpha-ketoglutarate-dependent taurine dioxygenase
VQRSESKSADLEIRPLAGRIGAQIENIRLSGDLPDAAVAAIEAALARYRVILFRGQEHLDDVGQERFAARLGDLVAHPTNPARPGTAILELDSTDGGGRADHWHTDITFVDAYPKISILRSVVVPPFGGDTVWANTVAAYEGLPPALKALAENLWAVHSNLYDYAAVKPQATAAGFDLSGYQLDGPLPELPETNGPKSRQKLLIDLARRQNLTIRQLYLSIAGARGHWQIVGTPEQIVDQLEERFLKGGADGFNVMAPYLPGGLEDFIEFVIPELRRRRLFRSEYEGRTLRENLGLPHPGERAARFGAQVVAAE